MARNNDWPERIAVLGVGLIGGSVALAWREAGFAGQLVGFDTCPITLEQALTDGPFDSVHTELAPAVGSAELVVVATPIRAALGLIRRCAPHLSPGTVVTDVCSTKVAVVAAMDRHLPPEIGYVGGHPLAGSEKRGFYAARAELFEGAIWVLTPGSHSPPEAQELVSRMVRRTGASVREMAAAEHDRFVAVVSHLPQLAATSLMLAVVEHEEQLPGLLDLAAGGLADTTRIAASDAAMWADICMTNRDNIIGAVEAYRYQLKQLVTLVEAGDPAGLAACFAEGAEARRRLDSNES